ncbi:MAG: hypothetical protein ACOY6K_21080 [Pseudomonadota bacterium]
MSVNTALAAIPEGLRAPLLSEFTSIVQNFAEHRWSPAELSGGKFCEIVYTILDGFAKSSYATAPSKPRAFDQACRGLENQAHVPRSFQILIPRVLPALYEVRNNRGVGHAGGDVDPNQMDAIFVVNSCSWVMAELVRVFHNVSTVEAQRIVDGLVERRVPLLWIGDDTRRILDPKMSIPDQVLVLSSTSPGKVRCADLLKWTDYKNATYFRKVLRQLHDKRLIELSADETTVQLLPPGDKIASELIAKAATKKHRLGRRLQ